jgi:DNA-binding beta-propeller fold protein YncE
MGTRCRHALVIVLLLTGWSLIAAATPAWATEPPDCGGAATPGTPNASPVASAATPAAGGSPLMMLADIPLPDAPSRFDYQSLDPASGRLFIAHMGAGQLVVFDTATRSVVGTVDDLPTVTGVLAVPELGRVYAAVAGEHQIAVIDDSSLEVVARVGEIGFPDGLAYAPQARRVFVSDESGGGELVLDADTNRVVASIDIGGEAGNTQYDAGSGCILVAVQSRDALVAIDPARDRVVGRYALPDACQGPHGFTIDTAGRRAFVSCEDNATLLVVDLTTMRVTGTLPVGDRPDVPAFDAGWGRLYVASEAGTVSVFDTRGALQPMGEYRAPHAHSVAVDPATHLVYLPLENVDGRPVLRVLRATG